jgi:hypothetical protein
MRFTFPEGIRKRNTFQKIKENLLEFSDGVTQFT